MAPTNFQIYDENSAPSAPPVHPVPEAPPAVPTDRRKFLADELLPKTRFAYNIWKHYPIHGDELSIEEIRLAERIKLQRELEIVQRLEELERENIELKQTIETLNDIIQQHQQKPTTSICADSPPIKADIGGDRLSIIPQSLQPVHECMDMSVSMCKDPHNGTSVIQDMWRLTKPQNFDKFTFPIDQSQFIKENIPTSTPSSKRHSSEEPRRNMLNNRRMSRPNVGGSPTLKLSPITETSRDGNSKSSSSSSAMSATPSTVKKVLPLRPVPSEESDKEFDPNDPSSYHRLLVNLSEPIESYPGFYRINRRLPDVKQESEIVSGSDIYMIGKQLSEDAKMFTAQLINDDSDESIMETKTVCVRVDQPANHWIFYICSELHKRLAKAKSIPDIELSIMMTNPALMYVDGSILVDEYSRFVTLQDFLEACNETGRIMPKAVAAYITVELIQVVRQIHSCDIVHQSIKPSNVLLTCCLTREDIENVDKRTSIVKLIGFDRGMDLRLCTEGFRFKDDWVSVLDCIHWMFFGESLSPISSEDGRLSVDKQFKGFPTNIWSSLFDELLNFQDQDDKCAIIDRIADELNTWIKANLGFVLKEAVTLEDILEKYRN